MKSKCVLFSLPLAIGLASSRRAGISNVGDKVYVCDGKRCNTSYTEEDIVKKFPGVFMTKEDYAKKYQISFKKLNLMRCSQPTESHEKRRKQRSLCKINCLLGQHDGDQCCGTCKYFDFAPTFVTVDDGYCWVLQLPASEQYQFVPIGSCSNYEGSCSGECREEDQLHQLVCVKFSGWFGVTFHFAYISKPGYCSCKS